MREKVANILQKIGLEEKLISEIETVGRVKKIKANETLISPGIKGNEMPIVLTGLLKVSRKDDRGQEAFLYFLEGGETCAMSITCCVEQKKSTIYVVAEEDTSLWMVPVSQLENWMAKYASFRRFILRSYQSRFDEMINTLDSVMFLKMDQRLYKYLLDKKQVSGSYEINKTHKEIAKELNTSRVVVSRLLKQLEREGKIEQSRNKIEIL